MPKTVKPTAHLKSRIAESQVVNEVLWMDEPTVKASHFQDLSCVLFGVKGIGKTPFLAHIPGIYIIATEPGTNWQNVRSSEVTTCATFKHFVKEIAPIKASEVSMWGLDTLDNLEMMFINSILYEWDLTSMSDEGFAGAWFELQRQMDYWLKRLFAIGPGLIMTSHERDREYKEDNIKRKYISLDLVKRAYKAVSDFADLGMRMKVAKGAAVGPTGLPMRCISTYPSAHEDCWNRTGKVPALVQFKTEAEAVQKILACFDGVGRPKKKVARKKVIKKVPPQRKKPPIRR